MDTETIDGYGDCPAGEKQHIPAEGLRHLARMIARSYLRQRQQLSTRIEADNELPRRRQGMLDAGLCTGSPIPAENSGCAYWTPQESRMTTEKILSGRPRLSVDYAIILRLRDKQNLGWSRMAEAYRRMTGRYISRDTIKRRYLEAKAWET